MPISCSSFFTVYLNRPGEYIQDKAGCEFDQVCLVIMKLKEKNLSILLDQPKNLLASSIRCYEKA